MIEVSININRELDIVSVQAVRISPTGYMPLMGQECEYELYINTVKTGVIVEFPYGSALALSSRLLGIADDIIGFERDTTTLTKEQIQTLSEEYLKKENDNGD
jgi:hypothetical protein